MLTLNCDLNPPAISWTPINTSTSPFQLRHTLPLQPDTDMTDAEALTLADFGFPDEAALDEALDIGPQGVYPSIEVEHDHPQVQIPRQGYAAFRASNPKGNKRGRPVGWRMEKSTPEKKKKLEMPSPEAPKGYAAFRLANPGAKKVGRPVGWRKALHGKKSIKKAEEVDARLERGGKGEESTPLPLTPLPSPEQIIVDDDDDDGDEDNIFVQRPLQEISEPLSSIPSPRPEEEFDGEMPPSFWEEVLEAAGVKAEERRDSGFDSLPSVETELVNDEDSSGVSHISA